MLLEQESDYHINIFAASLVFSFNNAKLLLSVFLRVKIDLCHFELSSSNLLIAMCSIRFADAFTYLISLPQESHIWCGSWDIMGPLLETFYNYFKDESHDSPLRRLWKRISMEMNQCIQCVCQHHQAKDMYSSEYELSSIGPLLDVLRRLDEERVTQYLRNINHRISQGEYDAAQDNSEVVSVVYEVCQFPAPAPPSTA